MLRAGGPRIDAGAGWHPEVTLGRQQAATRVLAGVQIVGTTAATVRPLWPPLTLAPAATVADDGRMSELLTVAGAAKLAGVSVRTMRRRVAAGQVVTAGHGQSRRIVAASVAAPAAPSDAATAVMGGHQSASDRPASTVMTEDVTEDSTATRVTPAADIAPLAELVERLTERLAEQTGLTAMWQERAGTLADRLAAAESKIMALAAPSESSLMAPGSPQSVEPTVDTFLARLRPPAPWLLATLVIVAAVVVLVWSW